MKPSNIPAGLLDENVEIFAEAGINYALVKGHCVPYNEFPQFLLDDIDASIDQVDNECLTEMGMVTVDERRQQWSICNVSKLDNIPDYKVGSITLQREFVQCDYRNVCPYEGRLCRTISQLTGLTKTQIIVIAHIRAGLLNKEIADKMGISIETVRSHTQNIRIIKKLGRKADLALYAQEHGII